MQFRIHPAQTQSVCVNLLSCLWVVGVAAGYFVGGQVGAASVAVLLPVPGALLVYLLVSAWPKRLLTKAEIEASMVQVRQAASRRRKFVAGTSDDEDKWSGSFAHGPAVNVNGTPMVGSTDIHGNSYGYDPLPTYSSPTDPFSV